MIQPQSGDRGLGEASLKLCFSISGLKERLDYLSTLKVKGFVLGPIHKNQEDDLTETNLEQIDPIFGSQEDFESLLHSAKKKGGCPRTCKAAAREDLGFWPRKRPERTFVWFIADWLTVFLGQVQGRFIRLQLKVNLSGGSETSYTWMYSYLASGLQCPYLQNVGFC